MFICIKRTQICCFCFSVACFDFSQQSTHPSCVSHICFLILYSNLFQAEQDFNLITNNYMVNKKKNNSFTFE